MTRTESAHQADQQALRMLLDHERILLTGHVRPDGDCIGAQAALYPVLKALGKQVRILNSHLPEAQFDYLTTEIPFDVDDGGAVPEHDVVILLDCSEISRTQDLAPRLEAFDSKKMVIDHHILPEHPWWDAAYVDTSASATGLLVYRIAKELGVPLSPVARKGVFTSIVSDTGWFKYSNTDGETLAIAAELVAQGLHPEAIYASIYQRKPASHPMAVANALQGLRYHARGRLATIAVPLAPDGSSPDLDSDDVLDMVRSVGQVEVVLFVREMQPGVCKLSARSKTDFDVNRLARQFGGGGHAKASGATLSMPLAEAERQLVAAAQAQAKATAFLGWLE
ncbi:MAG TPA: bifunctional oligoribonuclease/PAP phosphatase NrnA [Planctomycetota bacterium]|nr:bifunctional oligoribonuclease/PAP phosphatase NrnA [Planctomycetota bacterium]